jgi:WD40 repeat protein
MAVHYSQLESKPCQIIGGFENGSLINWDIRNPHHHLSGVQLYDEPITCMDYCPNSSFGVCGSPGNILKSFCCSENNLQLQNETVLKHSGQNDVSIRTDGKIFGSGGWDSRLRVFSCKKLKPLAVLEYHSDSITTVDFFPETSSSFSNVLAAGSRDRKITFWRIF